MKPGTNGRRPRGRPNRKHHGGPARPNNFDSGGSEGRIRGNAHQVYERYLAMARDAVSAGDRIASETYYQHAEHYFRILNSSTDPQPNGQGRPDRRGGDNRPEAGQDGGRQDGRPASESQEGQAPALAGNGQDAPPAAQPRPPGHGGRHRRPAPPREAASGNGGQTGNGNPEAQPNPQAENDCEPAGV